MDKTVLLGISIVVDTGIIMATPITAYPDSDIQSEKVFEHIMTIDIHDQSTIVYSFTKTPTLCEIEYTANENDFSEPNVIL